jgi:hypothetical protein
MTAVLDTDATTVGVEELQEQVTALEAQVVDLQQQLRRARRGYVSKAAVQRVIDEGRRRRFWCAEAQTVAEREGVIGPDKIKVKVDLGIYGTATIDVDADQFDRLEGDEAKKSWLGDQIKISVKIGGTTTESALKPPVESFEEVIQTHEEAVAAAVDSREYAIEPRAGYQFRYVSRFGRSAHIVSETQLPGGRARCGVYPSGGVWQEDSPQAESYTDWNRTNRTGEHVQSYTVCQDCRDRI